MSTLTGMIDSSDQAPPHSIDGVPVVPRDDVFVIERGAVTRRRAAAGAVP